MANSESRSNDVRKKHILNILLIISLGLIIYSNTLNVPFVFDDETYIVENPIVQDNSFFTGETGIEEYDVGNIVKISHRTRYVGYLSFYLNYAMQGLKETGYHIGNLLIHVLNSLLLYLFVVLAFRTPFLAKSRSSNKSHLIALFSALLFISHPIQTQAVDYISQRFASLATLFYLSSLTSYTGSRISSSKRGKFGLYTVSLISAVIAMKTKEIAFTLPVSIALFEFLFFESAIKKRIVRLFPLILTMAIIPLSITELGKPFGQAIRESMKTQYTISHFEYFVTQFRVLATYLRLLLFPINQNLDYDYPIFTSFFNPNVAASFVLISALLALGFYFLHRSKNGPPELRLSAFGVFWFFIALSVESSFIALADVIFEHRAYLPSAGLFVSAVTGTFLLKTKLDSKKAEQTFIGILVLLIVIFSFTAHLRNYTWREAVILWEDTVSKSPNKARVHNNLGFVYGREGLYDKAIEQHSISLRMNPDDKARVHNNLGFAYGGAGLYDKAIEHFRISLRMEPGDSRVFFNLGLAYLQKGDIPSARREMEAALKLDPENEEARKFLQFIRRMQDTDSLGSEYGRPTH